MLTTDIPWNPQTLQARFREAQEIVAKMHYCKCMQERHLANSEPWQAAHYANRLVEFCDELERAGYFNLARGRVAGPVEG